VPYQLTPGHIAADSEINTVNVQEAREGSACPYLRGLTFKLDLEQMSEGGGGAGEYEGGGNW